jgi:hypothetical protein
MSRSAARRPTWTSWVGCSFPFHPVTGEPRGQTPTAMGARTVARSGSARTRFAETDSHSWTRTQEPAWPLQPGRFPAGSTVHPRDHRSAVVLGRQPGASRSVRSGGQAGRPSKSLTMAQAEKLLAAAHGSSLHAYIVLSLLTGARTEEVRALRWEHVDLTGRADADQPVPPRSRSCARSATVATPRPASRGAASRCRAAASRPSPHITPGSVARQLRPRWCSRPRPVARWTPTTSAARSAQSRARPDSTPTPGPPGATPYLRVTPVGFRHAVGAHRAPARAQRHRGHRAGSTVTSCARSLRRAPPPWTHCYRSATQDRHSRSHSAALRSPGHDHADHGRRQHSARREPRFRW